MRRRPRTDLAPQKGARSIGSSPGGSRRWPSRRAGAGQRLLVCIDRGSDLFMKTGDGCEIDQLGILRDAFNGRGPTRATQVA
jgi:hypothetical protein